MKKFTAKNSEREINKIMQYQITNNESYIEIVMSNLSSHLYNVHRFYRICGFSEVDALIKAIDDYEKDKDEFIEIGAMAELPICF